MNLFRRILLALTAGALIAAPVLAETVKGNGVLKTQAREVAGFSAIGLGINANVEVKLGGAEGITIEADENILPLIETTVRRGELEIKAVRHNLSLDSRQIRVAVQAKQVDALDIGGSGSIVVRDAIKGSALRLNIGGSGSIAVFRAVVVLVFLAFGGSGSVKAGGSAKRLNINIAGSGDADAHALVADDVDINIAGAGDALIAARSSIAVAIAGSGNVQYWGDPAISKTVFGSGRIKRLGPLPQ